MSKVFAGFGSLLLLTILCSSCSDDKSSTPAQPTVPVVSTAAVDAITQTTATCGGSVTADGGATVTARGVCWSTNATPTLTDSKTTDGDGTGSFTSSLTDLTGGTTYYVRAYASNSAGTGYGGVESFATVAAPTTVTDIDGNVYQTVTIGTQVWMAENLKVTHYRNGDSIPNVIDGMTWDALATGACCSYDNSPESAAVYGLLYNWFAVDDSRNIAPEGWHVPTDADWGTLVGYLGSDGGGKLKETGTVHWLPPNAGATNETGFTALAAGQRGYQGQYSAWGQEAYFWSSTEYNSSRAYVRTLDYYDTVIYRRNLSKPSGHSIRCVKD